MRAGAIGDVLLLRPAVHALRRAGLDTMLMAPAASGSVLVGSGGSEAVALLDWERADVGALLHPDAPLPRSLEARLAGIDVALAGSRSETLAARLRTLIPRVASVDPAPPPGAHAAAWYCSALRGLGIEAAPGLPPPLVFSAAERARAEPLLSRLPPRFLAVHPGSGSPAKNWPAQRYAALVAALAGRRPWLIVEGPADGGAAGALGALAGAVCARALDLRTLGAVFSSAGLVVGNDSGITHLAAAAGAPTLALFGPTDPAQWAPLGPRVRVARAPGGEMERLEVDAVVALARSTRRA